MVTSFFCWARSKNRGFSSGGSTLFSERSARVSCAKIVRRYVQKEPPIGLHRPHNCVGPVAYFSARPTRVLRSPSDLLRDRLCPWLGVHESLYYLLAFISPLSSASLMPWPWPTRRCPTSSRLPALPRPSRGWIARRKMLPTRSGPWPRQAHGCSASQGFLPCGGSDGAGLQRAKCGQHPWVMAKIGTRMLNVFEARRGSL